MKDEGYLIKLFEYWLGSRKDVELYTYLIIYGLTGKDDYKEKAKEVFVKVLKQRGEITGKNGKQ